MSQKTLWLGLAGVVLVDELDLHLHPQWQREIVTTLRTQLPKLTFVVTTHNPLTLLGARPGEVHVMDRGPSGIECHQIDIPLGTNAEAVLTGAWFKLSSTLDDDTRQLVDLREPGVAVPAAQPHAEQATQQRRQQAVERDSRRVQRRPRVPERASAAARGAIGLGGRQQVAEHGTSPGRDGRGGKCTGYTSRDPPRQGNHPSIEGPAG